MQCSPSTGKEIQERQGFGKNYNNFMEEYLKSDQMSLATDSGENKGKDYISH